MNMSLTCLGCGANIQTTNENKPGYAPSSALEREDILCRRCFRLKHYNETEEVSITDDDFFEMVSTIRHARGLVVYIVDLFDVTGSIINNLPRMVGDQPVILVGNKRDLLPQSTNERKLSHWLRRLAKEANINVQDVYLISSIKGHGIDELTKGIEQHRRGRDVYIVGVTNVGKSTLVNRLIEQSSGLKEVITTSYFPGTTLGFIEIPLDESTAMIDTPGIVNHDQMAHYVSPNDLKLIMPKKEIKARNYHLKVGQTLFFGGLARLDYVKGNQQTFVCYFSRDVHIHRTQTEKAEDLYDRQQGDLLSPPDEETMKKLPSLTPISHRIDEARTDVVFPGLGWVTILDGDATVRAYSSKNVPVTLRDSFV